MKKHFGLFILLLTVVMSGCNKRPESPEKLNPKEFQADLEKFVVEHSDFTDEEAKTFIPLFREMRENMFILFKTEQKTLDVHPESPEQWTETLNLLDSLGVEKARIEQKYHRLMLKSIPAEKIMESVRAEDDFLRESIHRMKGGKHHPENLDNAPGPHSPEGRVPGNPHHTGPHPGGPQGGPHPGGPQGGPHPGGPQGGPHPHGEPHP